ncbi:MAG: glutathione S-transferase family protein [Rhizobiales bacterium]|nr:glutathione S-transferase family protein [Hyphomicrobiales bacterium]
MSGLQLVIGNKNYSSWSMRPWLAMTQAGIKFQEVFVQLDTPKFLREIRKHSGAARVPVLHHGDLTIWDSLAILEYVADVYPAKNLWPKNRNARAQARSACAEMHAGFQALRNACPMNLRRPARAVPMNDAIKNDIARIETIWRACRKHYGKGGPFLFGKFSNADAMYAPAVTRFETYAIPVAKDTRCYMDAILSLPSFKTWKDAALKETWVIPDDEVD